MPDVLHIVGAVLALAGGVIAVLGAYGVLRFPDVYTRLHAASITDTAAATLLFVGLGLMSGLSLITLKLVICWIFLMIAGPTASHAVAAAAYSSGVWPWTRSDAQPAGAGDPGGKGPT
jgi:multicomponent Na+:H+ antiporter subunit G